MIGAVLIQSPELPVNVRPVEGSEGKYSVEFPPSGSGEYIISANILDKVGYLMMRLIFTFNCRRVSRQRSKALQSALT
jgi:hypothetical protein